MPDDSVLLSVLESLHERGALGEPSLPRAVAHAESFVAALPAECRRVLDLGSGGGLPGLVVASRCPALDVVLTDRRQRRTDLLRLAVAQLGMDGRVTVECADVVQLADESIWREAFDAVTARAFGPPLWTLQCAAPFLRSGGVAIVSEPPTDGGPVARVESGGDERWPAADVVALGFHPSPLPVAQSAVRRFVRV